MSAIRKLFSWRVIRWLLLGGLFIFVCMAIFAIIVYLRAAKEAPSVEFLSEYSPPVMTRVHAGDGNLIMEYAEQHRVFVPIESIPKRVQHAFVAAEDQRFYEHDGFDRRGFMRAMVANVGHKLRGERLEGGSTITQQVAKNILVGRDRTVDRKLKEIITARRIEKAMDKDHVMELYLNEIYLGDRSYGVAAAALNYFGKSLEELHLSEIAYLAALPKAPNNYDLTDDRERAMNRRNYVLGRMVEDGYIEQSAADEAKTIELENIKRLTGDEIAASGYFIEEARKEISTLYGTEELYEGGLSIRTTLDTELQLIGRNSLRGGLEAYDKRYGYRGPLGNFENFDGWKTRLDEFEPPKDIEDWRVALVLEANETSAKIGLALKKDEEERPAQGTLAFDDMKWARPVDGIERGAEPKRLNQVLELGDVILVSPKPNTDTAYRLEQVPEVNGGLIAMDPHTGRILALVGGYSFQQAPFNRATQAKRQPGSAFKPIVYAAALDNGFTPSTQILDAPFVIPRVDEKCYSNENGVLELRPVDEDGQPVVEEEGEIVIREVGLEAAEEDQCERFYKPGNYAEGRFYGLSTLRLGLEKSRNAMTVRLANDIGMTKIMEYGERFGIYDEAKPELGWVLGAGETTMVRLSAAYSAVINGGKRIDPYILDRVQDGQGKTIYLEGNKPCLECMADEWTGGPPPDLEDIREQVIDPVTAYQVTYMMQGVIENGTGVSIRSLGRPLGGKTGTTNDYKDAWFMGFSPDMVVGVYVGYDKPRTLNNEAGSKAAAPIFKEFMRQALDGEAEVPFRIPEGVSFSPVNRNSGEPSFIGAPEYILEAFKPGTEPQAEQASTTIRVGSGTDSFIGGYNNIPPAIDTSGDDNAPKEASVDPEDEDDTNSETEPSETPSETNIPVQPSEPAPAEPEDPEEEDLDDGLY